jgi:formylglycine-generating enzyme required for sulfatase activity
MFHRIVISAFLLMLASFPAHSAARIALVIGNAAYANVGELANPYADATAVAKALKDAGFEDVRHVSDLSAEVMRNELKDFSSKATTADIALIYYAGHGAELETENYLVPVDAKLLRSTDLQFEAVSLTSVRAAVAGATKLRIVVLDACRNNPFKLASLNGKRAATRGLAAIEPGAGEVVAYSAKKGTVAQDGPVNSNSPFASALIKSLNEPGLEIRLMFGRIRDDVLAATANEQEPYTYASLGGDAIYLKPALNNPTLAASVALEWQLVSNSRSPRVLEAFLKKYGADPIYGGLAHERLALLSPPPQSNAPRSFRDCPDCPEMLNIPAGRFIMGSVSSEPGFDPIEGPQHPVTINKAFAVSKFEISLEQFKTFASATGYKPAAQCLIFDGQDWRKGPGRSYLLPHYTTNDQQPVTCVSWHDAKAYVDWLSSRTSNNYRLLTEAEWEYAARAGTTNAFGVNALLQTNEAQFAALSPANIGSFSTNAFGLHDMLGNVWEWTEDCYVPGYDKASPTGQPPVENDCKRTYRGGGWAQQMKDLRMGSRGYNAPETRVDVIGFRVAKTLN